MQKALAVVLVLLGGYLVFKTVLLSWMLFLLIAIVIALLTSSGTFGKWGYGVALLFALLAIPGLFFGSLRILLRFLPILLVFFGLYMLIRPKR